MWLCCRLALKELLEARLRLYSELQGPRADFVRAYLRETVEPEWRPPWTVSVARLYGQCRSHFPDLVGATASSVGSAGSTASSAGSQVTVARSRCLN